MPLLSLSLTIIAVLLLLLLVAVLLHIFVVRPWYRNWGATAAETRLPLPGDEFIPPGADVTTRAITIHAPAEKIWPLLLQIGTERAGFYSYYWLENLFGADMPAEHAPRTELAPLKLGDLASMLGGGPPSTKLTVTRIEPWVVPNPRWSISFTGWTFFLQPLASDTTRLIVRYPFRVDSTGSAAFFFAFFELAHFIMESGMMMGIKQQAEAGLRGRGQV